VHVTRIGLTPLKSARHARLPAVDLTADGPAGDRLFCLVDRRRGRVLRTVEHPVLLATQARWDGRMLHTTLPGGTVEAAPEPTGDLAEVDYWGRTVVLEVQAGPWAAAYSGLLGYDVQLARSGQGDVVYGGSVSLVTTSSLDRLGDELGVEVDSTQFRATFTVDTGDASAHVEDTWVGRRLRLGEAEVRVVSVIPRCAVVDLDPDTGERHTEVLRSLARYRRGVAGLAEQGGIGFGVDAVVTRPGRADTGADVVMVERG
jgi:MOSC domain-containing protein